MDPFAAALAALFRAPGSAAAEHVADDETVTRLRVILSRPDQLDRFGQGQIATVTAQIEIQASDVAAPARGDIVTIGVIDAGGAFVPGQAYRLTDEPLIDDEGMTWRCGAEPIPLP